jgi:hypothetical protein
MTRGDHARAVIMRRRLLFLGQALALCGCASAPAGPAAPAATGSTRQEPQPIAEPGPSATGAAGNAAPASSASAAAAAPTLQAPVDARPELREQYEGLARIVQKLSARLDQLARLTSDAESGATKPAAALGEAGKAFNALERDSGAIRRMCKSAEPEEQALEQRSNEQYSLVQIRIAQLRQRWVTLMGEQPLLEAKQKAYAAEPYPCLSIHCKQWW